MDGRNETIIFETEGKATARTSGGAEACRLLSRERNFMKVHKRYLIPALIMLALAVGFLGVNAYFSSSNVVVYMYHSVREIPVNVDAPELSVRPSEFEKQLKFFGEQRMISLFASELGRDLSKHGRYVAITFDDGYEDNYTEVFPLLKKYNIKATIFMITSLIGKEGYLTADQIKEMTESGLVSVQSHTVSHEPLALGDKEYEEVDYEFAVSKYLLERITGAEVNAVAMPNGSFDAVVMELAKKYYDVIFTDISFRTFSQEDICDIHRVGIYRRHDISDVKAITNRRGLYIVKRAAEKLLHIDL